MSEQTPNKAPMDCDLEVCRIPMWAVQQYQSWCDAEFGAVLRPKAGEQNIILRRHLTVHSVPEEPGNPVIYTV